MSLGAAGIFVSMALLLCNCTGLSASCDQHHGLCVSPWKKLGGSCYRITPKPLMYDDAGEACRKLGAEMAAPRSDEENHFMADLAPGIKMWIACTNRVHEGEWECEGSQNGGGKYTNWMNGEPNNSGGKEHCAVKKHIEWNDVRCEGSLLAVCRQQPRVRCFTTNNKGRLEDDSCL